MQHWNHFWLRTCPPHALALVRIALGCFLLVYALTYAGNVPLSFSREGLILPLFTSAPSQEVAYGIYFFSLLMLVAFTLGAYFRVCSIACFVLGLYYWQLQLHLFPSSYNRILCFCLLVLLFSGAHKTFSFDMKRVHGSWNAWEPISILPQRLISLQISLTFIAVGLQKWMIPMWGSGEILVYTFIGRWSTPLSHWLMELSLPIWIYDWIVFSVKILQPLAGVGAWFSRFRVVSLLFISIFLLLVAILLGIWWFVFLIPACLLFFPPEEIQRKLPMETGSNQMHS